jgi:hypothetical protein
MLSVAYYSSMRWHRYNTLPLFQSLIKLLLYSLVPWNWMPTFKKLSHRNSFCTDSFPFVGLKRLYLRRTLLHGLSSLRGAGWQRLSLISCLHLLIFCKIASCYNAPVLLLCLFVYALICYYFLFSFRNPLPVIFLEVSFIFFHRSYICKFLTILLFSFVGLLFYILFLSCLVFSPFIVPQGVVYAQKERAFSPWVREIRLNFSSVHKFKKYRGNCGTLSVTGCLVRSNWKAQ